jgi:hypothetical protein
MVQVPDSLCLDMIVALARCINLHGSAVHNQRSVILLVIIDYFLGFETKDRFTPVLSEPYLPRDSLRSIQ